MTEQKHNQRDILYSPKNWAFLAFFLSPILPAIFFYKNSKLLGTSEKAKKVLIGTIIFVIAFLVPAIIFSYYAILIILIEAIIAVIIAKKLAKTQLTAYEEMKKIKGLKGGRNEAPVILLFLVIWITIGFVIPYAIDKYIEKNYITTSFGSETIYLPKKDTNDEAQKDTSITTQKPSPSLQEQEKEISKIGGKIALDLPKNYVLSNNNESVFEKSYKYRIQRDDGSFDQASWEIFIIPIEAVQHFDAICAPGDCMRDYLIFPKEAHYLSDLEAIREDDEPIVTILNGQKYYIFTMPIDGDTGYSRQYIMYYDDIRVVFTAWAQNEFEAEKHDDFLEDVKILSIK